MIGNVTSPEEIRRRKNFKKGIDFTILVCGQEGNGKSSFINSLCKQKVLIKDTEHVDPKESHLNPGMSISRIHVNIVEENSTPISLDVILTSGFGDNVDNRTCTSKVIEYLERQFDEVLEEECRIQRDPRFKDGRPHAALYFIRPTSRGLRELDVEAMKELSTRVNVIPVMGKSDSLTKEEITLNKALILQDIRANHINTYDFATETDETDEILSLRETVPFAVSGSYESEIIDDVVYNVRRYPWGVFKVEDVSQSDFTQLRNALFGSHLQELKDSTHSLLYGNYRKERLEKDRPKLTAKKIESDFITANYKLEPLEQEDRVIATEDDTLKEILRKKRMIEDYTSEIKKLEERLRSTGLGYSTELLGDSVQAIST